MTVCVRPFLLSCVVAATLAGCRTASAPPALAPWTPEPIPEPTAQPLQLAAPPQAGDGAEAPPRPPDKAIALGVRVEALTNAGQHRFITSEEALRTGDKLALHVRVDEPAHVYVGLTPSAGSSSVLFPRAGTTDEIVASAVEHRIPRDGWFKLDRHAGHENIFVYASRSPLSSEQTLALVRQDTARVRPPPLAPKRWQASAAPSPSPQDDGPGMLRNDRGLKPVSDEGVEVEGDPDLTRAHFLIKHVK